MVSGEVLEWRLSTPQSPDVDVVEFALGCDAVALHYGPHPFRFAKSRLPSGDLLLTLSPDEHGAAEVGPGKAHILGDCVAEVHVPALVSDHHPGTRERSEAILVRTLGRALFRDVAHMVDACTPLP